MGPCWIWMSDWKWQEEQVSALHLNGRLHSTSVEESAGMNFDAVLAQTCHNMCLPLFDMVFKFLIYHFDIWESKGKK